MHSTLKPKQADDPHDVVVVAPDVARVVPAFEELSNLLREAARHSTPQTRTDPGLAAAPPVPPVDTTFRATAVNDVQNNVHATGSRRPVGSRVARAFTALLLTTCIGVVGFVLNAHGDVAKQIAKSVPKLLTSLLVEKPGLPAQPAAPAVEADAASADAANAVANAVSPQPAPPPAPAAPESAVPGAAASSPDQGQLLQSMAHDLAGLGQQVEQLKASIEELKAGQQQMSRDMARAPEQSPRPKLSAISPPPPRPAAVRLRKPMPPLPPPQAAVAPPPLPQSAAPYVPPAAPYVPRQVEPPAQTTAQPQDEELSPVPRPPMPVR
jgi:hypothetical protein